MSFETVVKRGWLRHWNELFELSSGGHEKAVHAPHAEVSPPQLDELHQSHSEYCEAHDDVDLDLPEASRLMIGGFELISCAVLMVRDPVSRPGAKCFGAEWRRKIRGGIGLCRPLATHQAGRRLNPLPTALQL